MCIAFSLVRCSDFVDSIEGGKPWYLLLVNFLLSLCLVIVLLAFGASMTLQGYRGVVESFVEAWEDLTVEVELSNRPVVALFEQV